MRKFAKRSSQRLNEANNFHEQSCWKIIAKEEEKEKLFNDGDEIRCDDHHSTSYDSTKEDSDSSNSFPSSSSSDLIEVTSSSSSSNGPLFKLSDLMSQLPIKRGLSKYYEGKSQSYATLASVESLEDLAKRENPHRNKRIKYCKSFCGGLELDHHNGQGLFCNPIKATTISKKTPSNSEALFFFQNTRERC